MTQATQTPYDCTSEVMEHINLVRRYLDVIRAHLSIRAIEHDRSKLVEPEKSAFDQITPLLRTLEYGSPAYREALRQMKPAIDHHYRSNRHHPEHFVDGVAGMDLIDLVEMVADWMAAADRKDGNVHMDKNIERFKLSPQLTAIIDNTIVRLRVDVVAKGPEPVIPTNKQ